MGVVYKAEDTKLERTVLLKFLRAGVLNSRAPARGAAALDHLTILYDLRNRRGGRAECHHLIAATTEALVCRTDPRDEEAYDVPHDLHMGAHEFKEVFMVNPEQHGIF